MDACTRVPDSSWNWNCVDSRICSISRPVGNDAASMDMAGKANGAVAVAGRAIETLDLPGREAARAIVLLHEGLASVPLWRDSPRALHAPPGRRLVAFSRHGHGRSE